MSGAVGAAKTRNEKRKTKSESAAFSFLFSFLVFLLSLFCVSAARAALQEGETSAASASPAASSSSAGPWLKSLSFLSGAAILNGQTGIALGLRGDLPRDFVWEVGGIVPHDVTGYASGSEASQPSPGSTETVQARVSGFGETHLAVFHPLLQKGIFTVEGGAGLSIGIVRDDIDDFSTIGSSRFFNTARSDKVRPGPLAQVGALAQLTPHIALRLDVGYVYYVNNDGYQVETFNLNFGGVMIRPAAEWKF